MYILCRAMKKSFLTVSLASMSFGIFLLWWVVVADYTYTSESMCHQWVCSELVCEVDEKEPYIEVIEHREAINGELLQEIANYLVAQWEQRYADIIIAADCGGEHIWTTETKITPDSTEACTWTEPVCGNNIIDGVEECDLWVEKNGKTWEYCSIDCKIIEWGGELGWCGNYITEPDRNEQCDLWPEQNGADWSWCSVDCKIITSSHCDDMIVDTALWEQCDLWPDANGTTGSWCTDDCQIVTFGWWGWSGWTTTFTPWSTTWYWNWWWSGWGASTPTTSSSGGGWAWWWIHSSAQVFSAPTCNNYIVDYDLWEQCDLWPVMNGADGSWCSDDCQFVWWEVSQQTVISSDPYDPILKYGDTPLDLENIRLHNAPDKLVLDPAYAPYAAPASLGKTWWWILSNPFF